MAQRLMSFVTRRLVKEDEARSLVAPIREDLLYVWTESVRRWNKLPEDDRARLSEWGLLPPTIRFGYSQSFAKERFRRREAEGIIECDALQVFTFYVKKRILIRFNSVDSRDLVVRNIDGDDSRQAYFSQERFPDIDSKATRLTCGYTMDAARANLASVVMSCQIGDDGFYSFSIENEEMKVLPMPLPTAGPKPKPIDTKAELTKRHPK